MKHFRFLSPLNEGDQESLVECSELKVLSSYYRYGLTWAKSAQREAMMLAVEEPSIMATQALECLQLYWFGVGDAFSGNLCLGNGSRPSSWMTGYMILDMHFKSTNRGSCKGWSISSMIQLAILSFVVCNPCQQVSGGV